MHPHQEIITAYSQADFEGRLSLFLKHPTLRNRFVQIDQGDYNNKKSPKQKPTRGMAGCYRKISKALDLLSFY
jgi:hypothetical protein